MQRRFSVSPRQAALWAGLSLLLMAVLAGFSYGYVLQGIPPEEIPAQAGLYCIGLLGWWAIFLLDIVVSWALYEFFREAHRAGSLLTAVTRLVYTAIFGVAIAQLMPILTLMETGLELTLIEAQLGGFERIWNLGLIVFGGHLLGLGWLSMQHQAVPNWVGWLLYIAGLSYILVLMGKWLLPSYAAQVTLMEDVLSLPMALGELAFAVWLLVKGGK